MKCTLCGSERMTESVEDYVYDRHGIAVTLVGIRVLRCPDCGEEEVEIPRIAELDRTIARDLIEKPSHLVGVEVRFLRKLIGFSGRDFAELLGAAPETVSRWENDRQPIDHGYERAIRLLAAVRAPIEDYRLFDALRAMDRPSSASPRGLRLRAEADKWSKAA